MDPLTATALAIGTTAASAGVSIAGANAQNKAIRQSMESQNRAAQVQQRQLQQSAQVERDKVIDRSQQIIGRLRVARGESAGLSLSSGSTQALMRQATFDTGTDLDILERNLGNQQAAVRSGAEANIASLQGQTINPMLAAFAGGLQGINTGLSIAGGIQRIGSN